MLLIDVTALLEALKEKIEKVKLGEISLNRVLADAVIGENPWPPAPANPIQARGGASLNEAQSRAYNHALRDAITFIWGPPGCGKTKTLGEVVRSAYEGGKRVLVCSNTNKAVDQVLYEVCKALGLDHPAMKDGRVVRMGRVADNKLKEYREFVTIDGIVERRSVDLKAEKQQIEDGIERIDVRTKHARQILARFERLDKAERQVATEQEHNNQIDREGRTIQEELSRNEARQLALAAELEKRRTTIFKLLLRSEATIRAGSKRGLPHFGILC